MKRKKGRYGKGKERMGDKKGRGKVKREREKGKERGEERGVGRGWKKAAVCVDLQLFCLKWFNFDVSKIEALRSKVMAIIC